MQRRIIDSAIFQEGIREFARRAGAELQPESDTAFMATFPDGVAARISNDALGLFINYSAVVAIIHDVSLARIFLQENWLGVEGTPFYFSVTVDNGQAFLFLEAIHAVQPGITPKNIADILGTWQIYWPMAKQSLDKVNSGLTKAV